MEELFISWGKEILSIFLLLPIIWFFIRQSQKNFDKTIDQFDKITNAFIEHTKEDWVALEKIHTAIREHNDTSVEHFKYIMNNMHKPLLTEEQTLDIFASYMWYVSSKKLDFIKSIILNNHIEWRRDFIVLKVKNWLAGFSMEYEAKFNTFNTRIWNLSKWLDNNFTSDDFDLLIKEIVDIIYRDECDMDKLICANNKINEISQVMRDLQNNLRNKLRKDLYNNPLWNERKDKSIPQGE